MVFQKSLFFGMKTVDSIMDLPAEQELFAKEVNLPVSLFCSL